MKITLDGGDDTRSWAPPYCGDQSTYFLSVNRNKKVSDNFCCLLAERGGYLKEMSLIIIVARRNGH